MSLARLTTTVMACMAEKLCPIIMGGAGIGKTDLIRQISERLGARMLHLYAAHLGAEELKGLFFRSKDSDDTYSILVNEEIKDIVQWAIDTGKPAIIFLDEINRAADIDCLNAIFSMISKRGIPNLEFPDNLYIIAAGNPPTGNFAVAEMDDDAFIRRLVWLGVKVDAGVWLKYASGKKSFSIDGIKDLTKSEKLPIHPSVISYITANSGRLSDEELANTGKPYPNPASWEAASGILKTLSREGQDSPFNVRLALSGLLGQQVAGSFVEHYVDGDLTISPDDVLDQKWSVTVKKLNSMKEENRHDLASDLVNSMCRFLISERPVLTKGKVKNLVDFLDWLEEDQQALFSKGLLVDSSDPDYGEIVEFKKRLMNELQKHDKFTSLIERLQELRTGAD